MDTEEKARREIVEEGLQRITAAGDLVSQAGQEIREADSLARSGAAMVAHMANMASADARKGEGRGRRTKAKQGRNTTQPA